MGFIIDPDTDKVYYCGKRVFPQEFVYWALYKPTDVICSCKPDTKYKRVIDFLPQSDCRLYPVGRLDVDSEGLIIITNDGALCNKVTHPKFGIKKEYMVKIDSIIAQDEINKLESGVLIDDNYLAKPEIKKIIRFKKDSVIHLILNEGRNREIRKIFEALGKKIILLKRLRIGPVKLDKLNPGQYRPLKETEITAIKNAKAEEI